MKKFGDIVFLAHGTINWEQIIEEGALKPKNQIEKKIIERLPDEYEDDPFEDDYGYTAFGSYNPDPNWVYFTPIKRQSFKVCWPSDDGFHPGLPNDYSNFFPVVFLLCPSLLSDRHNWYCDRGWNFGEGAEYPENKLNWKNLDYGGEVLVPDPVPLDKYLIVIIVFSPEWYDELSAYLPDRYKKILVYEEDMAAIVNKDTKNIDSWDRKIRMLEEIIDIPSTFLSNEVLLGYDPDGEALIRRLKEGEMMDVKKLKKLKFSPDLSAAIVKFLETGDLSVFCELKEWNKRASKEGDDPFWWY